MLEKKKKKIATCLFSFLPNHVVISCSRIQNIAKRESIILTNRTKVKVRQSFYEKIESNIMSSYGDIWQISERYTIEIGIKSAERFLLLLSTFFLITNAYSPPQQISSYFK